MKRSNFALGTEKYLRGRAGRANRAETLRILGRSGKGNPPLPGDELPAAADKTPSTKKPRRRKMPRR